MFLNKIKSLLKESIENLDFDDAINLQKYTGDYYYYACNYSKAIDIYKTCLDLTSKSSTLNSTLFHRELEESLAICYSNLGNHEDALKLCSKLVICIFDKKTFPNISILIKILLIYVILKKNIFGKRYVALTWSD